MTAHDTLLSVFRPVINPLSKKRVLLVDASPSRRDLRAEIMRRLGMEVDCASDVSEARCWWRADLYNLVLINAESELASLDKFCEDLRKATPPQQLAFLVGKPEYVSDSPNTNAASSVPSPGNRTVAIDMRAAMAADVCGGPPQRWGILEACQRISAVRSVADARLKAIRERPARPPDLATRAGKQEIKPQAPAE